MAESREFYIDPSGALAFAEMVYRDEDDEWEWWQDIEAELEPFGLKAEPTVAEASFYVNVRVDVFAGWLFFYTSPDIGMSWPGADDSRVDTSFFLNVAVPTKRAAGLEPILAIVHGAIFLSPKETQGLPTVKVDLEKIGEIEIIPLESDRSEVIITNWIKECQEIFDWLLEEIIERWPEAGKQTTRKRDRQAETLPVVKKRKGASRLEDRPNADENRKIAQKYLERRKRDMTKKLAASFTDYKPKTLDRWVKRFGLQ